MLLLIGSWCNTQEWVRQGSPRAGSAPQPALNETTFGILFPLKVTCHGHRYYTSPFVQHSFQSYIWSCHWRDGRFQSHAYAWQGVCWVFGKGHEPFVFVFAREMYLKINLPLIVLGQDRNWPRKTPTWSTEAGCTEWKEHRFAALRCWGKNSQSFKAIITQFA